MSYVYKRQGAEILTVLDILIVVWKFLRLANNDEFQNPIQMWTVNSYQKLMKLLIIWIRESLETFLHLFEVLFFIFLTRFFALYYTSQKKLPSGFSFFSDAKSSTVSENFFKVSDEVKFSNYKNVEK